MRAFFKKHKKRIIRISILLVVLFVLRYVYLRFPVITGYAAKNMCSCVFVAQRDAKYSEANELNYSFIKYTKTEVDYENKSVSATLLGLGKKTAYYIDGKGCVLLNDGEKSVLTKNKITKPTIQNIELPDSSSNFPNMPNILQKYFDRENIDSLGTRAIVVLHNGVIVGEQYSKGFDENSLHLGWSMTKSIFNALIGIGVQKNIISLTDKALFEEWTDDRKDIALSNILKMNSGLYWNENYGNLSPVTQMLYNKNDMISYVKSLTLNDEIAAKWQYSSGSSNLLSGYLREKINNDQIYFNYPYKELFAKIGAPSFVIETDGADNYVASSYAWATAKDWAKFGLLYAQNGSYNKSQILPNGWIDECLIATDGSEGKYSTQFWLPIKEEYPNCPDDLFFADGFQGQRIFIMPKENLVIVRLGLTKTIKPSYDQLIVDILEVLNIEYTKKF